MSGATIAVTGAGGYLAGRLIEALQADDRIERILGFDVRAPLGPLPSKLVFDEIDVRNPALADRLRGVDVLVHLAFIMDPIKDEALMRDVNVHGSHNVFDAAAAAGVGKIVYTSSGVAYGAHPDNGFPLTEEHPLRANLDFSYPAHKLEVEYVMREFRSENPDTKVVILRPSIVFGPHVDNSWFHMLIQGFALISVKGHAAPLQFVHENDVAQALRFAVFADLDGPYNLTPADHLSWEEMSRLLKRRRVELSERRAWAMAEKMWDLGLAESPAGMLHYAMYPWVMTPERLTQAGFECSKSSAETFAEVAGLFGDRVRLGHRAVRRSTLAKAAAGAGLLGAAAIVGARRRTASSE